MKNIVLLAAALLLFGGCALFLDENLKAGNAAMKSGNYAEAMSYFQIGCDKNGDRYSCNNFGVYSHQNKDYVQAVAYLKKACGMKYESSCDALGNIYKNGDGVTQDYGQALSYYEQACYNAYAYSSSCEKAAEFYKNGIGTAKNEAKAQSILERACTDNYNSKNECYQFGMSYLNSGNTAKAKSFFEFGCERRSDMDSCKKLSTLYAQGEQKDYFKASSYLEKACNSRDRSSCYELAVLYTDRKNPIANANEAKRYFDQACAVRKDADMCYKIAILYTDKKSGVYNMQTAKSYFQKACDFGLKDGCNAASKIK
ncbi:MAG: sel1 repeat family protein [Campylobacteraceae bacterium]|jgi:TPR repeat protein|nr:sel1 repeat family protein [Campylobacteraceae bacterium]